ncbi:MAG: dTMP kinase [Actinobacteria bacterium]|nr:dTMP kinase [Actinomycetota bacterium]
MLPDTALDSAPVSNAEAPTVGSRGRFIVFEGGEACGKSTQARLLADRLGAVLTREPGGTPLSERLRDVLLDPATGELDPRTELLLMVAARAEHVARVIAPALASGRDVVCDRFSASSVAYQAYGRGLDPDEVARVSNWGSVGVEPDLVVLLEVDDATRDRRLGLDRDRLEDAGEDFHARVRQGFRALATADPDRWVVLDGGQPIDVIAASVSDAVDRTARRSRAG